MRVLVIVMAVLALAGCGRGQSENAKLTAYRAMCDDGDERGCEGEASILAARINDIPTPSRAHLATCQDLIAEHDEWSRVRFGSPSAEREETGFVYAWGDGAVTLRNRFGLEVSFTGICRVQRTETGALFYTLSLHNDDEIIACDTDSDRAFCTSFMTK